MINMPTPTVTTYIKFFNNFDNNASNIDIRYYFQTNGWHGFNLTGSPTFTNSFQLQSSDVLTQIRIINIDLSLDVYNESNFQCAIDDDFNLYIYIQKIPYGQSYTYISVVTTTPLYIIEFDSTHNNQILNLMEVDAHNINALSTLKYVNKCFYDDNLGTIVNTSFVNENTYNKKYTEILTLLKDTNYITSNSYNSIAFDIHDSHYSNNTYYIDVLIDNDWDLKTPVIVCGRELFADTSMYLNSDSANPSIDIDCTYLAAELTIDNFCFYKGIYVNGGNLIDELTFTIENISEDQTILFEVMPYYTFNLIFEYPVISNYTFDGIIKRNNIINETFNYYNGTSLCNVHKVYQNSNDAFLEPINRINNYIFDHFEIPTVSQNAQTLTFTNLNTLINIGKDTNVKAVFNTPQISSYLNVIFEGLVSNKYAEISTNSNIYEFNQDNSIYIENITQINQIKLNSFNFLLLEYVEITYKNTITTYTKNDFTTSGDSHILPLSILLDTDSEDIYIVIHYDTQVHRTFSFSLINRTQNIDFTQNGNGTITIGDTVHYLSSGGIVDRIQLGTQYVIRVNGNYNFESLINGTNVTFTDHGTYKEYSGYITSNIEFIINSQVELVQLTWNNFPSNFNLIVNDFNGRPIIYTTPSSSSISTPINSLVKVEIPVFGNTINGNSFNKITLEKNNTIVASSYAEINYSFYITENTVLDTKFYVFTLNGNYIAHYRICFEYKGKSTYLDWNPTINGYEEEQIVIN